MSANIDTILKQKVYQAEALIAKLIDFNCPAPPAVLKFIEVDLLETALQEATQLENALQAFLPAVRNPVTKNPTITLAAIGTTSGGKSSLVNLLCGAEIMPVGVQEVSAGIVVVDHHPSRRTLKIPKVAGLPVELSGEWLNISDADICMRLQSVMDAYRQLCDTTENPPPLRIQVQYPIRLRLYSCQASVTAELPTRLLPNCHLRIIDLPGFKHIDDDRHRKMIRNEIKSALCLVTYNSEETDSEKQGRLLQEIADQLQMLHGSPSRLLFILNRIDAFGRDNRNKSQIQSFIYSITEEIKKVLAKTLPEHGREIDMIRVQPLSAYPALCAYTALYFPEYDVAGELRKISRHFRSLIPDTMVEQLPQRMLNWNEHQRLQVAEAVWQSSFGAEFFKALNQHIQNNLLWILFPELTNTLRTFTSSFQTILESINDRLITILYHYYYYSRKKLDDIDFKLTILRKNASRVFFSIVDLPDDEPDIVQALHVIADNLQRVYGLPEASLAPLYDWVEHLSQALYDYLNSVYKYFHTRFVSNSDAVWDNPSQTNLTFQDYREIERIREKLHYAKYSKYAQLGGIFRVNDWQTAANLQYLVQPLEELAVVLTRHLKKLLNYHAELETKRIQSMLQLLVDHYSRLLCGKAQAIAPEIAKILIMPPKLICVRQRLFLNFQLAIDWGCDLPDLEIWKKASRYGIKIKPRVVRIPSVFSMFGSFWGQMQEYRHEDAFYRWFRMQVDEYLTEMDDYQKQAIGRYRHRTEKTIHSQSAEIESFIDLLNKISKRTSDLRKGL